MYIIIKRDGDIEYIDGSEGLKPEHYEEADKGNQKIVDMSNKIEYFIGEWNKMS